MDSQAVEAPLHEAEESAMNEAALRMAHSLIADAERVAREAKERGDMTTMVEAVAVRRYADHLARVVADQETSEPARGLS